MDRVTKVEDKKTEKETNLPEEWKRVRLGEVLSFKNGKSPQIIDSGTYPIYGSNGLIGFTNDYFLDGVFLLVGRVGASGETHLVSGKLWASDNCLIGECKSDVIPVFMYYLLKYFDLKKFITQTAQPLITQSFISNFQILLPPLPEQRKIAKILETVDNAIEKTDKIIEKYRRIKHGLMQELLTKGIEENGQIRNEKTHKFKDSPLGRIPEEWEVVELGEVANVKRGASPRPIDNPIYFSEKGRGWIRILDITSSSKYLRRTTQYLSSIGEQKSVKVEPDELIMSICATIGKPIIVKIPACIHDGFVAFKNLSSQIDLEYLFYYLIFKEKDIREMGQIGTQGNINSSLVSSFKLLKPPLFEQQRIALVLSQVDKVIESEQRYKEKLERIKQGLMEDLLTGKVRVTSLIT
jgi:type I restriction enzyme S subunit